MHTITLNEKQYEIRALYEGIFRVRTLPDEEHRESMLTRYGILKEPENDYPSKMNSNTISAGKFPVKVTNDSVVFEGCKTPLSLRFDSRNNIGFELCADIDDKEKFYGLGDLNRKTLNKRGLHETIWTANVTSYGPIPYIMSSKGWGILVNCTFKQEFDIGAQNTNILSVSAKKGLLDFYVFLADDMKDTLELYTRISGRPVMMPRAAYGLTCVCHETYGARELMDDCLKFRDYDIPCDIMGLEPGWMETYYDYSLDKKWDTKKFYLPWWLPQNQCGGSTFLHVLRRQGMKLSLWLCCDYDLFWKEENAAIASGQNSYEGAEIIDPHFESDIIMDKITKPTEPWFEHLKTFVDNGAVSFKLDGANQVIAHPDRLWAGKYTDDEAHNVYPVVYAKQMKEGFQEYTGRRSLIYTAGAYAGTQQYAATWAGDTGGGEATLVSVLNFSLSGHTNTSCDMGSTTAKGAHYGFLMPWAQYSGWCSWDLPWYMGKDITELWRRYSKLRSSLFPYIYSMSHKAAETGLAVARPMCLMYPEDESIADAVNIYMLGDSLLVGAFNMDMRLPEGKWRDMFTGEIYGGGKNFTYSIPDGYGGALFMKEGSVIVTQEPKPYLDSPQETPLTIHVYPGCDCEFTMYQDDGVTYGYLDGEVAKTKIFVENSSKDNFDIVLKKREGTYTIKSDVEYDISSMGENHSSNVRPLPEVSGFGVKLYVENAPKSVKINGKNAEFGFENGVAYFEIPKELHETDDCTINVAL